MLWISQGVTLDLVAASGSPEAATRWWPFGSEARVARATALVQPNASRDALSRAAALARAALAREPVSAPAARVLGQALAQGRLPASATRAFAYAESMSRRDLPTELILIETSVAAGDVPGALTHYDRALRTNEEAGPLLLPTLAAASAEPSITARIDQLLDERVGWRLPYLDTLSQQTLPPTQYAVQFRHGRLNPQDLRERGILSAAMTKLLSQGQVELAYSLLPGAQALGGRVLDGGFESVSGIEPFGWWYRDDPDLFATREPGGTGSGSFVLRLSASTERGGEVARQVIVYPAGHYRITGLAGDGTADAHAAPYLFITCYGDRQTLLNGPIIAAGVTHHAFVFDFTVPAACPAQTLRIMVANGSNTTAWLDDLTITPVRDPGAALR